MPVAACAAVAKDEPRAPQPSPPKPDHRRTSKNYSGKRERHGLHFLAITDERGRLIWISAAGQKTANKVIAAGRAPVEHSFAHPKTWRILTKLRTDPARATNLLRAQRWSASGPGSSAGGELVEKGGEFCGLGEEG